MLGVDDERSQYGRQLSGLDWCECEVRNGINNKHTVGNEEIYSHSYRRPELLDVNHC
jgi:hypothetical protein